MALEEVKLEETALCLICGKRIAAGSVAYEDDEAEADGVRQIYCCECYDEMIAEIDAEDAAADSEGFAPPSLEEISAPAGIRSTLSESLQEVSVPMAEEWPEDLSSLRNAETPAPASGNQHSYAPRPSRASSGTGSTGSMSDAAASRPSFVGSGRASRGTSSLIGRIQNGAELPYDDPMKDEPPYEETLQPVPTAEMPAVEESLPQSEEFAQVSEPVFAEPAPAEEMYADMPAADDEEYAPAALENAGAGTESGFEERFSADASAGGYGVQDAGSEPYQPVGTASAPAADFSASAAPAAGSQAPSADASGAGYAPRAPRPLRQSDDGLQGLWSRYHNYMAESLQDDMVEGLSDINSRDWTCVSNDMENVISQGSGILELGTEVDSLIPRLEEGRTLIYGWPLVAIDTADGMSVAPLLVVNIAQPPYPTYSAEVLSEPVINPAILRAIWSHSSDVNFLRSAFGDEMPRGAVAVSKFVSSICEIMGLPVFDLDPLKLVREMPSEPGVYNMAVLTITSTAPVAADTVDELRAIADFNDWSGVASASLFGVKLEDVGGRDTTPVMPWSAESVFEDSLQLIRTKAVTILNMTQRDVIDQLIASACANAWIDNESVLVMSDNEKKLDELAALASDVHSALLVRACVDEDLLSNPKRRGKCTTLSALAKILLDEVQAASSSIRQILDNAYKELEKVEKARRVALEGAAFRKKWNDKKIRWESARVEIAKRIWQQGLYPQGTDPKVIGPEAKSLEKVWMLKGVRASMFMHQIGAKPGASLQDVVDWSNISLHIKQAEAEMKKVDDPDKYNIGAVNYRWASSCIGAVSARVSGALSGCSRSLETMQQAKTRNIFTKQIVTSLVPHLKAWAADYYSANQFFDLVPGLFDVLICDNANHMNLSWILPWAFRAKRLVIIGDPNGVPPSVFLDGAHLSSTAAAFGFDRDDLTSRFLEYGSNTAYNAFSST